MGKTKEEIINKVHPAAIGNNYFKTVYLESVKEMMDEWAKQQSISFAEFIDYNAYINCQIPEGWVTDKKSGNQTPLTSDQLYDLFLTQQPK